MSLFKAREWWHTQSGNNEEFDGGGLCVFSLGQDDEDARGIIFTGSLQGMLRAYQPGQRGFKPEDVLYEQELEQAVLQLEVGRFSSAGGLQLAVLHPKLLAVFAIQPLSTHLQVTRLYEHHMDHTAANMCYGEFGGAKGVDHICVQSYDGQLSFFECELFTFARYLPNFLIPGPIAYVATNDLIVTATAGLQLEAYRYKSLAAASGQKPAGDTADSNLLDRDSTPSPAGSGRYNTALATSAKSAGLAVGKKVTADWKTVLGETAIEIRAGRLSSRLEASGADIVVLCEHHVFVVSSTAGNIMLQRRLEYHPAAACLLPLQGADGCETVHNLLVATHNKSLAVYHGHRHVWAAKLNQQPVAVKVATLGHPPLPGCLVCVDQDGWVAVSYMGTQPSSNTIAFTQSTTHDYDAIAREQRALTKLMQEHMQGGTVKIQSEQLSIKVQLPSTFDHVRGGRGAAGLLGSSPSRRLQPVGSMSSGRHVTVPTLAMRLLLTCQGCPAGLDDVSLSISLPPGVTCEQDSWVVDHVEGDAADPAVVSITLSPASHAPDSSPLLPTSRHAQYVASYQVPGTGEQHVQTAEVALPFCLFASLVPPVKNAVYRITVSTNKDSPLLTDIFTDMSAQATAATMQAYETAGANVLTFSVAGIADVTILVSKSAGRYRLQSDCLEVMWLVLAELMQRLEAYYGSEQQTGQTASTPAAIISSNNVTGQEGGQLQWSSQEMLPLQDVQEAVDAHWSCRQQCRQLRLTLQQRAVALRVIQKRLLMRFKDQHPSPLSQLDTLLEETYASLQETAAQLEKAQAAVRQAAAKLSGILHLLLLLCKIKFQLSASELSLLGGALCVDVTKLEEGVLNQPPSSTTAGAYADDSSSSHGGDIGWEEHAEASLTQLLRTSLARNSKEAAAALPDTMQPAQDAEKLKRLLGLVLERLSKGQRLVPDNDSAMVHQPEAA